MNRMQEYRALLSALEQEAPQMTRSLLRARQRRRRQRWIRPAAAAAGVWIGFVLLVNWSVPVAQACARVPVLRELARRRSNFPVRFPRRCAARLCAADRA
jgi:hypothetical protein